MCSFTHTHTHTYMYNFSYIIHVIYFVHTHQENIDSILNPAYLPHPPHPHGDADDRDSSGSATPTTSKRGIPFAPPPHPDIINCGPAFRTGTGTFILVYVCLLAVTC